MCVDDVVRLGGEVLERVQIYILTKRLKSFFLALSERESSLVQKSCTLTFLSSVYINQQLVIQGFLTLRWHGRLSAKVNKNANLGYSHDRGLS